MVPSILLGENSGGNSFDMITAEEFGFVKPCLCLKYSFVILYFTYIF